jgi:hypothetical protein
MTGIRIHVLTPGASFDLSTRQPTSADTESEG